MPGRFEEILERISEGLLLLDEGLKPTLANSSATSMLGLSAGTLPPRLASPELLATARTALASGRPSEVVIKLWFPAGRTLKASAMPLSEGGGVLITLRDITEEVLAQQIRREFVAHASHELKSPVAGLQALAAAISQASQDDPEAAARFSAQLIREADRLGRLINDLLDLSRLEEPARIPDEIVALSEVARAEIERVATEAQAKGTQLSAVVASDVWVTGDAQQLGVLIRNLLENAIRYTPEGGSVTIEVRLEDFDALVSVADNGIGIPLESQGRVFERFYRVDRARSRDRGGTGLGLAIVKHVAELHGGSVEVESELGRGSVFTARLPAASADSGLRRSMAG